MWTLNIPCVNFKMLYIGAKHLIGRDEASITFTFINLTHVN